MKRLVSGLFAAAILALLTAGCTGRSRTVATAGVAAISADEFAKRYNQFLIQVPQRDNILLRQKILNNIINEKLIFEDIRRQGFDRDDAFRARVEEIRVQALLDRYSKLISSDTVSVSERELWQEFRAFNSRVKARYLYAKTPEGAHTLKQRLQRGETFESLAREVFADPGLANSGGSLGYFGWGEMEPALEDAAFSLPVGAISDPIHLQIGYAIVKVEERVGNPLASEYDFAKSKDKLSRVIADKKTVRLIEDEVDHISNDLAPSFSDEALGSVFDRWSTLLSARGWVEETSSFGDMADVPVVRFRDGSWTVGDFLERLQMTTDKQRRRVQSVADLKDMCIGLAAREVLLARARRVGLDDDPQVRDQVREVRDEYLLNRWRSSVQDTVGQSGWDEGLLSGHYEKHKRQYAYPPEVNVAEILVRTEAEARDMLSRLKRGGSFSDLARRYSIRTWAGKQGGELGFGSEARFGILGKKFFDAKPGQLIGPEFADPYFGVFKILAKRAARPKTLEEAREQIIEELLFVRKQEAFARAVGALRGRSAVSADNEVLANIVLD